MYIYLEMLNKYVKNMLHKSGEDIDVNAPLWAEMKCPLLLDKKLTKGGFFHAYR